MTASRGVREVRVGDCGIGGSHPIRVQSMTTTDTRDVAATADQAEALAGVGCEIVRITAPSLRDAEALAEIRAELFRRGVRVPLVADIHFTPNAALLAAEAVEKVRVNPGNFADKKRFEVREYSDAEYAEELERVADRFRPLVRRCKELGRALRIGTNHGSLSDRILNRFGDTPRGMVESAIEFLEVCEEESFHDVVFSMKASNPLIAIHAYRALAERLAERAPDAPRYPFHVGVTEAGDGADGRVKSAIGIGALLEDGLGETIRVSLTEDPLREIPVARALAALYEGNQAPAPLPAYVDERLRYERRETHASPSGVPVGGDAPVRVELSRGLLPHDVRAFVSELASAVGSTGLAVESVLIEAPQTGRKSDVALLATELGALPAPVPLALRGGANELMPFVDIASRLVTVGAGRDDPQAVASLAEAASKHGTLVEWVLPDSSEEQLGAIAALPGAPGAWVSVAGPCPVTENRLLVAALRARGLAWPIVLRCELPATRDFDAALLEAAARCGSLLCDGIGDVISLAGFGAPAETLGVAYRILQGARQRTSWTEFISCPSCGRTLFDLEETTARVKARTSHLPGLKIAVMGCVVNGPGEMADADFGYVGSGHNKVSLYVGQECVVRNVAQDEAPDRLVELIRQHDRWEDPA
jgi:(E)-4-hydroxy-3-methylbut-2-enyl-diphosphate synthase